MSSKVERGIYRTATGYQVKVTVKGLAWNGFVEGHENLSAARLLKAHAVTKLEKGIVPEKRTSAGANNRNLDYAFDETWKHQWEDSSKGYQKQVLTYYRCIRQFFVKELGKSRIDKIGTKDVDDFIYYLRHVKGNSDSTINNKLCVISAMFNRMERLRAIDKAPVIEWKKPDNARERYYTLEEEGHLYKLAELIDFHDTDINVMLKDFLIVLFATGMRPWEEAKNMQVKWLIKDDYGDMVVKVPAAYSKTNKDRYIPIHSNAIDAITRQSKGLDKDDALFKRLDYKWHCQRFWNETVRPAMGWGKDEVWYCIRHTFATRLCEAGANIRTVQSLMGHSNINQTAKYAKATSKARADAIGQLKLATQAATLQLAV